MIISATLSGYDDWKSIRDFGLLKLDWLRQFLPYDNGIPVGNTLARVMRKLDTKQFAMCITRWMQSVVHATDGDVIAIDGKTLRGSHDGDIKSPIHMVSAWSSANGVVLGQEKTAEKSNEITAIPELLNTLAIERCIVSIDAMGCQKAIAEQIISFLSSKMLTCYADKAYQVENEAIHQEKNVTLFTPVKKGKGQKFLDTADQWLSTAISQVRQPMVHVFGRLAAELFIMRDKIITNEH